MILFPVGSYTEYYQPERISKRKTSQIAKLDGKFKENIAWQEDVFAYGPPLADLRKAFADGASFMWRCLSPCPESLPTYTKSERWKTLIQKH